MKSLFKSRTLRHSSVKLMSLFDRLCAQSYSALLLGSITKSWSHVVFSRDGVQQDQKIFVIKFYIYIGIAVLKYL